MYGFPFQVDIDITERCNFKCSYCSAKSRKSIVDDLDVEQWKEVIDQLYDLGVCAINLAGGEPLLKPGINDLIEHSLEKVGLDVTLVTNGSILDEKIISFTANDNFHLVVSLDSMFPKVNEIYRDQTQLVISNLKKLRGRDVPFSISQVLTNKNIGHFFENYKMLEEHGFDHVLLIKYISSQTGIDSDEIPSEKWTKFIKKLIELREKGKINNYALSVACPWELYLPMIELGYEKKDVETIWHYYSPLRFKAYSNMYEIGCHAGITSCNILANGDVYPCSISGNNKELLCGNVKEEKFKDIWDNSAVFQKFRNIKLNDIDGNCGRCKLLDVCGGGCRIRAFHKQGSIVARDVSCPLNSL